MIASLHLVIFEDGGSEFLLDIADAVEVIISRRVCERDIELGVRYKRAGFAGTGFSAEPAVGISRFIRTKSMWS